MNPELRPATREDVEAAFLHLYGREQPVPVRILAHTGHVDGKVIAVGGIALYPSGARIAFLDIANEGRKYPLSLHRGAKRVLEDAKKFGVKTVVVLCGDDVHEKTPNWLKHLGFHLGIVGEGRPAYIWKAS